MSKQNSVIDPQPTPEKTAGRPIWELVIEDMKARDRFGREKYGTPLQAHNGRDPLVDLYQELLDACVYTRQRIEEGNCWRARAEKAEAELVQVDDVLIVNYIAAKNGDYRSALHELVQLNIQIENDPQVSETARARQDELDTKNRRIVELEAERDEWKKRAHQRARELNPALAKVCEILGWPFDGCHVKLAEELRQERDALAAALDALLPESTHEGPCGPEAGCDGNCMARAINPREILAARLADERKDGKIEALKYISTNFPPRIEGEGDIGYNFALDDVEMYINRYIAQIERGEVDS